MTKTITAGVLKKGDVLDTGETVTSVISEPTEDGWIVSIATDGEPFFYYEDDLVEIVPNPVVSKCAHCHATREWIDGIATAYGLHDHFCCIPLFKSTDR